MKPLEQVRWRLDVVLAALALAALAQALSADEPAARHRKFIELGWDIPSTAIPKRQWPAVRSGPKRTITFAKHADIVERETNPERRAFYQLLWHLGGSRGMSPTSTLKTSIGITVLPNRKHLESRVS